MKLPNNPRNPQLEPYDINEPNNAKFYNHHLGFQFNTNPMEMTAFEKGLVEKEEKERLDNKTKYIKGIQGVDGGQFIDN